jgi:hypothetical protein
MRFHQLSVEVTLLSWPCILEPAAVAELNHLVCITAAPSSTAQYTKFLPTTPLRIYDAAAFAGSSDWYYC